MNLHQVLAQNAKFDENGKRREILAKMDGAVGVSRESDLHDEIIQHCKSNGWIYFHGSMAHRTKRTIAEPDFQILADRGRVFFIEAKTRTGKLTPEQLGMKMWAEKLGHTIHECRSMDELTRPARGGRVSQLRHLDIAHFIPNPRGNQDQDDRRGDKHDVD